VTTGPDGLTDAEVAERVARGQTNQSDDRTSRTFGEIVRANVFTRFNAILGVMLAIVLALGSPQDGLFGFVLFSNALIGIVQEVRAKKVLDRLAILSAPKALVVRSGAECEVRLEEVVLDDLILLRTGDQVPCDGRVLVSDGLDVDESLLTGESDPVDKAVDSEVLSGSFVVAGAGRFQATRVGNDAYATKLASEARRFTLTRSELMDGINKILRYVTWILFPVGGLLLWSQIDTGDGIRDALLSMVAGVVGMVPQGLVLLTSIAFAVAAVTLARRQVLVQELPAVEGLARVDVVCLDKTGTLTDGTIVFAGLELLDGADRAGAKGDGAARGALGALADDPNANATLAAVARASPEPPGWRRTATTPFSSARKWSAASFDGHGTWVLGAPEMVWSDEDGVRSRGDELAAAGNRVLLLARSEAALRDEELPDGLVPVALVLLNEQVRPDASDALRYFEEQGVALKVISGDNPRTVAAVADRVGLADAGAAFDARQLPEDQEELAGVLERHSVFGRVTPHQKRAMVGALQSRDHVVAMTGDGVNDALALKDADIGIAMGSGAAATRSVAQLVLLDGHFATMPGVVAEGRRVIANIERVANLFVTKTVYSALIAVFIVLTGVFAVSTWEYPFLPRHLTLISDFTIGIPAFFLSLAPNKQRYVPGFIDRVLRFAIPAGIVASAASLGAYGIARGAGLELREAQTTATLVLLAVALWVLVILARPFTIWRVVLVATMAGAVLGVLALPFTREFFAIEFPGSLVFGEAAAVAGAAIALLEIGYRASRVTALRRRVA